MLIQSQCLGDAHSLLQLQTKGYFTDQKREIIDKFIFTSQQGKITRQKPDTCSPPAPMWFGKNSGHSSKSLLGADEATLGHTHGFLSCKSQFSCTDFPSPKDKLSTGLVTPHRKRPLGRKWSECALKALGGFFRSTEMLSHDQKNLQISIYTVVIYRNMVD